MEEIIRKIIEEVPSGCIFDSHYVIKTIISEDFDDYLLFSQNYASKEHPSGVINGQLAQLIVKQDDLCEQLDKQSFSLHLRDEPGKCAAFLRK